MELENIVANTVYLKAREGKYNSQFKPDGRTLLSRGAVCTPLHHGRFVIPKSSVVRVWPFLYVFPRGATLGVPPRLVLFTVSSSAPVRPPFSRIAVHQPPRGTRKSPGTLTYINARLSWVFRVRAPWEPFGGFPNKFVNVLVGDLRPARSPIVSTSPRHRCTWQVRFVRYLPRGG